jgi:transcriptional regulator with XRE-family HTH domain
MSNPPPQQGYGPVINRIADVTAHLDRYMFKGTTRLALDSKVSPSTITRILNNQINPSFALVARITAAIESEFGIQIDPRNLVAENGDFLTPFTCDLMACKGCLPESALDEFGDLKPAFTNVSKGKWVSSRYPKGFIPERNSR